MNNIREKFEAWAKPYYKEQKMSLNSAEHFAIPNEYMMTHYQSAYEGWQAANEQSQKEIEILLNQQERLIALVDEKDARIAELEARLNVDFPLLVKLFDNIDELKAREKVLVEAISISLNCIGEEINLNNYTETLLGDFISDYRDMVTILQYALANVRGEDK